MINLIAERKETPFTKLIDSGEFEYYIERGQIIHGRVLEYIKDGVLIDVGAKSEAFLPNKELADYAVADPSEILAMGHEYEFYILRDEAANVVDTRLIVSYKRVAQARIWSGLEELRANDEIIEARILEVVKGGVVVEIDGLKGFIPASHLRVKGGSNNPSLVGEAIPCSILEIDRQQNKLILSQKLAISRLFAGERAQLMNELLDSLKEYEQNLAAGQPAKPVTVSGEIVRITDFGAFIKISDTEMDGLLPLSEISWTKVNHPSDILTVGKEYLVQVLNVVPEQSRISLSLKRLEADPWMKATDQVSVGQIFDIVPTRHNNYGTFVTTTINAIGLDQYGYEAFLPLADMAGDGSISQSELVASYTLDKSFKAALKKVKSEDRKLIFSTKAVKEDGTVDMNLLNDIVVEVESEN